MIGFLRAVPHDARCGTSDDTDQTGPLTPLRPPRHAAHPLRPVVPRPARSASTATRSPSTRRRSRSPAIGVGRRPSRRSSTSRPAPRVQWADHGVLWRTFVRLRRSTSIGKSIDARQAQEGIAVVWSDLMRKQEAWIDFIADTGDGFAATYTVAYAASQPRLRTVSDSTERGTVLVLGGDLVYPTPTRDEYKHRLIAPLAAALPRAEKHRHIVVADTGQPRLVRQPAVVLAPVHEPSAPDRWSPDRPAPQLLRARGCPVAGGCSGWTSPSTSASTTSRFASSRASGGR